MSSTTRNLLIGFALAAAWSIFLATSGRFIGTGLNPPALETLNVSPEAGFDWQLQDLEDRPVSFSDFKGRTILLNVWATWCPPCRKEMPSLAKLAESPRIREKNIAVICVSTEESSAPIKAFLQDKGWTMTMLRADRFPPEFKSQVIPATFLIAPDGRIVCSEAGAAQWDDITVIEYLERLAATKK